MHLYWFLPTAGETRYLGTEKGKREVTYDYLKQVAQAVDTVGFEGALFPTGHNCEDAWVVASSLLPFTKQMNFLVALRPGFMSPSIAARMAATFDRLSGGRLNLNVVSGGNPVELAADGLHLEHDERYELADEYLDIWKRELQGERVDFDGKHHHIKGGHVRLNAVQKPYPPLFLGGFSPAAQDLAAKHVDVYLVWGEKPEDVKKRIDAVREKAAALGRTVQFGIRLHVVVRETEDEAWKAAGELIQYVDDDVIAAQRKKMAEFDSHAQQHMTKISAGQDNIRDLEISPNLWAGIGLAREGASTALVGDPDTVYARLKEYEDLGIDYFILSGYPHLEEAYRVGELLFPKIKKELQGQHI